MALSEGVIFGMCNPLLDISAKVDTKFLQKYNLNANSAILGDDSHLKIYEDLDNDVKYEIEYIPGGSAQNALRTASWILNFPNAASFVGCVGNDQYAEIMRSKAKDVGLNTLYQVTDKAETGKCAVLITNNERSLVAHLGAANNFTVEHLDCPKVWSYVTKAKIFYVSGFFFTVCPEAIKQVAEYSLEHNKTFSINLSAPFISQFFKDRLMEIFPYVDILFGNEDEAAAFSKYVLQSDTHDIKKIATTISNLPKKNESRKRIVIITQGADPAIVAIGDEVREFPVPRIPSEQIIDTNGAGDAFVGGFLAQFVKDEGLDKCVDCGIWASGLIIQRSGCTFPETMNYK